MKAETLGCKRHLDKIGILVGQLGTPDAPTGKALKPYLKEFLGDPRVIETNRILWWFILRFAVLTRRPKRSAKLYSRIWTKDGSPLLVITKKQTDLVRKNLQKIDPSIEVEFGMRYGSNSLQDAIEKLLQKGCKKIVLFSMYPQYSATTTAAIYDVVFDHLLKRRWVPTLRVAEPYYTHTAYVQALADVINQAYRGYEKRPERLVLSYHGIPEAYVERGDPYCCMCTETTEALLPLLNLKPEEVIHTYQSRFGRDPWLEPYTDQTIEKLANEGVKRIAVFCPGFTADCLETLDEIGNEGREAFLHHGGEVLELIPCLNDHPSWIAGMTALITEELSTWITAGNRKSDTDCKIACPVKKAKALASNA